VTARPFSFLAAALVAASLLASWPIGAAPAPPQPAPARIAWRDVAPLHEALRTQGVTEASFDGYVAGVSADNARRVREGDLDHLVHYLLQSSRITSAPRIEPALSARALVESLAPVRRAAFLRRDTRADPPVPKPVAARIAALLRAVDAPRGDARLSYFGALLEATFPDPATRAAGLAAEYLRVMAFDYQKEFVAQRDASPATAVAELYRRRGLSTDTAVEAGFVVHLGLGVLQALEPARKVRRVLIVGPGLDLAPRTAFDEQAPPESYQPWAVIDAVIGLGLADPRDLTVAAADINPRVVAHLQRAREHPPLLRVATSLREGAGLTLAPEYVEYVDRFGGSLSELPPGRARSLPGGVRGKAVSVSAQRARALQAVPLDIVTERLAGERFDLVVATNILPYFDDPQLALALANIAAMLRPGGAFVHNEQRPILGELTAALGMPLQQSRHAVIATVTGAKAPLYDSVFIHVRGLAPR
jgi:SAM-dependent methyltransferase